MATADHTDRPRPRAVVCLPTYNERENLEAMIGALDHSRWDVRRLCAQLLAARVVAAPADDPDAARAAAALRARLSVETDPLVRDAIAAGGE